MNYNCINLRVEEGEEMVDMSENEGYTKKQLEELKEVLSSLKKTLENQSYTPIKLNGDTEEEAKCIKELSKISKRQIERLSFHLILL